MRDEPKKAERAGFWQTAAAFCPLRVTSCHLIAAFTLLIPLLLTGCLSYREVSFKGITDMDVSRFDNGGVAARVMVTLDNPNNFRIHVIDPDVDLFLNDVFIGKATLDSNLVLEKRTTKDYAVPLHASFDGHGAQAMGAMLSAALSGKAKLKAKGTVTGKAFLIRKRFPFEEEHDLNWE